MEYTALDKKLQGFQLVAQEKLQAIICSIPGKKDLILESVLLKPLEHICTGSWLKLKGIQHIYKFNAGVAVSRSADIVQVFMIKADLDTFTKVLRHIRGQESLQPSDASEAIRNYHIICVPNCFVYFHTILEDEGLYGTVQLHRFNWDFIHLDRGLLSMEVSNVFDTVFIRRDTSLLPPIAHSLRVLQLMCGQASIILSYGENSSNIVKMMKKLQTSETTTDNNEAITPSSSDFNALLIIDRNKDYASALLTPSIYAGLLLEVFQHQTGEIRIDPNSNKILNQQMEIFKLPIKVDETHGKATFDGQATTTQVATDKGCTSIRLSSANDEIYCENRYKPFAQTSSLVRAQAKAIGLEVQKVNSMRLDEMQEYVARQLPKITELKTKILRHLNASEKVIEMLAANYKRVQALEESILNNTSRKKLLQEVDELLATDAQQYNSLRLFCLLHLSVGVNTDELMQFMRNYCNCFGRQHLIVFRRLVIAGLLPPLDGEKPQSKPSKLLSNLPIPKLQQTEFQANANRLKLLISSLAETVSSDANDNVPSTSSPDKKTTACPSYVFNNVYIPLAAQLCANLLKCNSAEDLAMKLGMVDKLQVHIPSSKNLTLNTKTYMNAVKEAAVDDVFPLRKRSILVFIVGGVTYSEAAACEMVGRLANAQIIVASNSIISGSDLIAATF